MTRPEVLAVVGVLALAACSPASQATTPGPPPKPVPLTVAAFAVAGVVVDAAGQPAPGAEVTLVDARGEIAAHVTADVAGAFAFPVAPGRWALSAQRPGSVGSFLDLVDYAKAPTNIRIALGDRDGIAVHGVVTPAPPLGTFAAISRRSTHEGDVFVTPVVDGTFDVVVPRGGGYVADLLGSEFRLAPEITETTERVDIRIALPPLAPPPREVVDYIDAHAARIATTDPTARLDDLAPLHDLAVGARVVALGEATHGTREFFQLKHRIVEYLVEKEGFRVFAIEANQPECRAINDYVLKGKGTAKEALAGIYFWTWNTEEVLAMIEWMRAWNADPAHRGKLQFAGFDMQTSRVAHATVAAVLRRVAPTKADVFLGPTAMLATKDAPTAVKQLAPDALAALRGALTAIGTELDAHRRDRDYAIARRDLRILEQAVALYIAPVGDNERDAAMAENIEWLLATTREKVVVWAHNGHVARRYNWTVMGELLAHRLRPAYRNLGFAWGHGAFQARDVNQGNALVEIRVGPPKPYYLSAAFSRPDRPLAFLDLRALPPGPVQQWFATPHPIRDIGSTYIDERQLTALDTLPDKFDAVIYVDETSRARPLVP